MTSVKRLFGEQREILRFAVSGTAGTGIDYGLYELLYNAVPLTEHDATWSWVIAYLISSYVTHALHYRLSFRWKTPYWPSLRRTYVVYACAAVLTTGLIAVLVALGMQYRVAFVITITFSGVFNYVAFRHWGFAGSERGDQSQRHNS
jgi:putative flippase GtrA